jgi:hypothetical protein
MKPETKANQLTRVLLSLVCAVMISMTIVISACDPGDDPPKQLPENVVKAKDGGTVVKSTPNGNAEVVIAPNSVVDQNGTLFTGLVTIDLKSHTAEELGQMNIGLIAEMEDDPQTTLDFVSILEVNLSDPDGNALNINAPATLRFPLADVAGMDAQIPLFSYHEESAKWIEEGSGALDEPNKRYVASAEHFSIWSIAKPAHRKVRGKVKDCNGNPVAGIELTINEELLVSTNSSGEYEALVKVGKSVTVVLNENAEGYVADNVHLVAVQGPNNVVILLPDMTTNCPATNRYTLVDFNNDHHTIPFYVDLANPAIQPGESYAEYDSIHNNTTIYLKEYNMDTAVVVLSFKGTPPVGTVLSSESRKSYTNVVGTDNNANIAAYSIPKPYVLYMHSANFSVLYSNHDLYFEITSMTSNHITGKFYGAMYPYGSTPGAAPEFLSYELENGFFSVTRRKKQ